MTDLLDRQREYTGWLQKGFPELDLKGLPLISACAITGNASQENLVRPVTTGPKDHGSDGVLQWRLDRLDGHRGLKGWSAALGLPWDTLKTQAAFTLWELYNDPRYSVLVKDLRAGAKKIETLVANFCWIYERPAKSAAHLDKRISHARSVYLILSRENSSSGAKKAAGAVIAGGAAIATANAGLDGSDIHTLIIGVVSLVAAGGLAVVSKFLGKKPEAVTHEPLSESEIMQPSGKDTTMGIDSILKVIGILEALVPLLQKALADLPKIREDLDHIKTAIGPSQQLDDSAMSAIERIREKIEQLGNN